MTQETTTEQQTPITKRALSLPYVMVRGPSAKEDEEGFELNRTAYLFQGRVHLFSVLPFPQTLQDALLEYLRTQENSGESGDYVRIIKRAEEFLRLILKCPGDHLMTIAILSWALRQFGEHHGYFNNENEVVSEAG